MTSGGGMTHTPGTAQINLSQTGVYQVFFHSFATVNSGVSIPTEVTVQLRLNGVTVPGAFVRYSFEHSNETTTLNLAVPVSVSTVPAALTMVVDTSGFTFADSYMTVMKIG